MPIDLSEVANDPDIGVHITIERRTGQYGPGGWQSQAPIKLCAHGVVTVAESKALQMVPEGDRVTGALQIVTSTAIYPTQASQSAVSDTVWWHGNQYSVNAVQPWYRSGFWSAVLLRMTGE